MHNQALLAPLRSFVRQLDLASLDLFVLICQTGSIGAAAEQGQLAISSVSKRIKELERELQRKEKALAETAALLVLSKKVAAIFNKGEDE